MSTTLQPILTVDLKWILHRAFSDTQAASWLLAKDQLPPTLFGAMMKHALTGDMLMSNDLQQVLDTFQLYGPSSSREASSQRSFEQKQVEFALVSKPTDDKKPNIKPEKLVTICHAIQDRRAYLTVTDTRAPWSIIEKPSPAVPGVRRMIAELTAEEYIMSVVYWLENGNSALITISFPLDRTKPTSRCMLLFKPYPVQRYPQESDVLESVVMVEASDCQFCLMRALPQCECPKSILQRTKLPFPDAVRNDPFGMWAWLLTTGDCALRKGIFTFRNHSHSIAFSSDSYIYMRPTCAKATSEEHIQGFKYYLDSVDDALRVNSLKRERELVIKIPVPQLEYHGAETERNVGGASGSLSKKQRLDVGQEHENQAHHPLNVTTPPHSFSPTGVNTLETDSGPHSSTPVTVSIERSQNNINSTRQSVQDVPDMIENDLQANNASNVQMIDEASGASFLKELDSLKWDPQNPIPCKFCSATFRRKYDLKRHFNSVHVVVRRFTCAECSKEFKRREHLENHIDQIHRLKTYGCEFCGRELTSEANLRRHVVHVHKDSIEPSTDKTASPKDKAAKS